MSRSGPPATVVFLSPSTYSGFANTPVCAGNSIPAFLWLSTVRTVSSCANVWQDESGKIYGRCVKLTLKFHFIISLSISHFLDVIAIQTFLNRLIRSSILRDFELNRLSNY